ncbi:MAG: superoxide dismutase [Fe] [Endozoicomonadaceae bacterium]|nr:superoxide dismutase [Fe] [Endozoicomonadaceae bacterium]
MAIELPPLPYPKNALSPHISEETLSFHYDKHHQTYVTNLNQLIQNTPHSDQTLETIIQSSQGPIFNNAAQVWNHSFYWNCLGPTGGRNPSNQLEKKLTETFGNLDAFREQFTTQALKNFGSGWTWLVENKTGQLVITNTSNAGCPLTDHQKPLLTCDVWEHAYYIDYRNARPKYLNAFWNLVNWDFVEKQLNHA